MELLSSLFDLTWGWVILGLILIGLELLAPGIFLLWLGIGAVLVGLVLKYLPDLSLAWQLVTFVACMGVSVGLGVLVQRETSMGPDASRINRELEDMVGRRYVATVDFAAGRGRIAVGDSSYAVSSDYAIKTGHLVTVVAVGGNVPRVEPVAESDDGGDAGD